MISSWFLKKKSDIVRVELQIEKFSGLPASIAVFSKNGISSTIRISKMKTEKPTG